MQFPPKTFYSSAACTGNGFSAFESVPQSGCGDLAGWSVAALRRWGHRLWRWQTGRLWGGPHGWLLSVCAPERWRVGGWVGRGFVVGGAPAAWVPFQSQPGREARAARRAAGALSSTPASVKCWSQMLRAVIADWSSCARTHLEIQRMLSPLPLTFLGSARTVAVTVSDR